MISATAAAAHCYHEAAFIDELTVCTKALSSELLTPGIRRIRHRLVAVEPRGAGYAFRIETTVYDDADPSAAPQGRSASDCRAQGSERLIELDIHPPLL